MTRLAIFGWLMAAAILFALGARSVGADPAAAQRIGVAAFKLTGVTSDCTVPRIAKTAPAGAAATVGPAGGESLTDAEARAAYNCVKGAMAAAYAKSGNGAVVQYTTWTNYSSSPYVSATHGNRYVNNYANPTGKAYGQYEAAGRLPVGTVLAKDSFVVNAKGQVVMGVLSLMEKMPEGFNPEHGDWRYSMILPDGREVGTTGAAGSDKVAFCAGCHGALDEEQDSLFFVPAPYRFDQDRGQ